MNFEEIKQELQKLTEQFRNGFGGITELTVRIDRMETEKRMQEEKHREAISNKDFLTIKEVSKLTSISLDRLYDFIKAGQLNAVKFEKMKTIIAKEDYENFRKALVERSVSEKKA